MPAAGAFPAYCPTGGEALSLQDLNATVARAQLGDLEAFEALVRRLQGMAIATCYGLLGDFQLAEDAAQESFLEAHRTLAQLREPAAFLTWFRLILRKQCDRITRRAQLPTVAMEAAVKVASPGPDPETAAQAAESEAMVRRALSILSEEERAATVLFYFGERSQEQIGRYLGLSVTGVKNRLRSAKKKLKKEMLTMVEKTLAAHLPDDEFTQKVMRMLRAAAQGKSEEVASLLDADPRLADAKGPHPYWGGQPRALQVAAEWGRADVVRELLGHGANPDAPDDSYDGWTPLHIALHRDHGPAQHEEVVRLLLEHGAKVDMCAASAMGDAARVRELLAIDPALVRAAGPNAATPLHFAATAEVADLLLRAGADPKARDAYGSTPLDFISRYGSRRRTAAERVMEASGQANVFASCAIGDLAAVERYLDARPAAIDEPRPGRDGTTLLHIAANHGHAEIVSMLLGRGAQVMARAEGRLTALHQAARNGHIEAARTLLDAGADINATEAYHDSTPLGWAQFQGHPQMVEFLRSRGGIP